MASGGAGDSWPETDDLLSEPLEVRIVRPMKSEPRIIVLGLGYVGLPLAAALARKFPTIGFDIDAQRIAELRDGHDRTNEVDPAALRDCGLQLTDQPEDCAGGDMYIVTVPTPVDQSTLR